MERAALLLIAVVLAVQQSSSSNFNCDIEASQIHKCSCSGHSPTAYQLLCPQLEVLVSVSLSESVQLQCFNDSSRYSTLTGLQIGDIDRFILRLCPLPEKPIKELMTGMGIDHIKMLQIQSYSNLSNTLKKTHLAKLYEVTSLTLNDNGLTSLPSDIFEDLGNLTWLDMKQNNIDLPKDIFYFTPKLEVLELAQNDLTHLQPGIFKNLDRLRLLNLWSNKLTNLTRAVFSDVMNLESLDLNSNEMETIRPDLFADLIKLKKLNLYSNAFMSLPQGLLSRNTDLEEFQMHENKRPIVSLPPGFLSNLTRLKMVKLTNSYLMSLPEDTFAGSKNINSLYMNQNSLKSIAEKTFWDLENVETIDLSKNQISHLPEELFSKTKKLKSLILFYNSLTIIQPRLFLQLKNLEYLDLRFNSISEVKGGQFYSLESLKTLNMSDNQLKSLSQELQLPGSDGYSFGNYSVLYNCKTLTDLQLANNSLTEINSDWRLLLPDLHTLNLSFNNVSFLEINDLKFFGDVFLDLSNNKITFVDFWKAERYANDVVSSYPTPYERDQHVKTKRTKLDNNPFNCDCKLLPFVQFIKNELSPEVRLLFEIIGDSLQCHEPKNLEKIKLNFVPVQLLTCKFDNQPGIYMCPENCSCEYRPLDKGNIINCQNQGLQQIPPTLSLFQRANHSELNLEGNLLKNFKIPQNKGYENVTHFSLANNNITIVNISGFSNQIQVLDLRNNSLTALSEQTAALLEEAPLLERLALNGNPWHCDCDAKPLITLVKNRFKKVDRLQNLTCSDGTSMLEKGELCTETAGFLVVICIVLAIIGFLIALGTTLYYRYQTEIHIYCFSSKWKLLRWMVSRPDIDEDKKYDAFISYAHQDEQFVVNELLPYLEETGETKFKVCVHFRDFIPGEMIPRQIMNSVRDSRRTIVVLSPHFLNSVWGKMEFKTAYHEALKDGTARIIAIMYEDVGPIENLDDELKAYLQINTYVKWGSPSFWKQLNYALPHPAKNVDDIECVFGCFPRINNKRNNSREMLQNMNLNGSDVHFVQGKGSCKELNSSFSDINKLPPLIVETDGKNKLFPSDTHQNGSIPVCV